MLADRRLAEVEAGADLGHTALVLDEQIEDGAAGGVGDRAESVDGGGQGASETYNDMLMCQA